MLDDIFSQIIIIMIFNLNNSCMFYGLLIVSILHLMGSRSHICFAILLILFAGKYLRYKIKPLLRLFSYRCLLQDLLLFNISETLFCLPGGNSEPMFFNDLLHNRMVWHKLIDAGFYLIYFRSILNKCKNSFLCFRETITQ